MCLSAWVATKTLWQLYTNGEKSAALSNLSIYYTWKSLKSSYDNNKFKTSNPTWIHALELPDRSYSISYTQDYFEHIIKKHSALLTKNPPIKIFINKTENRFTFKIKNRYYLGNLVHCSPLLTIIINKIWNFCIYLFHWII